MTLHEILKAKGLDDAAVESVIGEMKQNKIFTAGEENLDVRYGKLKTDHDTATSELEKANGLIAELKKANTGNEELQGKVTTYESEIATLKAENLAIKTDAALKVALFDAGAKASDIDYLIFKAKEKGDVKIGDDGKVKGQEELITGLKTQCPTQFATPEQKKVEEHKLEGGESGSGAEITKESFAKMGYQSRMKLFNEQPEVYKQLIGETAN